ncbi:hypothetical protein GCM10010299_21980 [Streptomyces tanashiensis]|nr:hypothetical protein GCM10010299_21980 [Streptomyces tanashiensis]
MASFSYSEGQRATATRAHTSDGRGPTAREGAQEDRHDHHGPAEGGGGCAERTRRHAVQRQRETRREYAEAEQGYPAGAAHRERPQREQQDEGARRHRTEA